MEDLAHESLIFGVNCHPLIKMTYVLHWICFSIINGGGWLHKMVGELSILNIAREGGPRNLRRALLMASPPPNERVLCETHFMGS